LVGAGDPFLEGLINYANNKVAAESVLLGQSDVPFTILRPPLVMGHNPSFARFYFQRLLDGKPLILTNGGSQPFQPIYRRDLARAFILALDNVQAVNQAYNIAQTTACPLVDWVKLASRFLGVEPKLVNVPDEILRAADFKYAELFTDNTVTVDISKAQAHLGFQPTPFETWMEITCRWYQETEFEDDAPGYGNRDQEVELALRNQ
jgi:nucleoside-diphosphate-sugar epimerase